MSCDEKKSLAKFMVANVCNVKRSFRIKFACVKFLTDKFLVVKSRMLKFVKQKNLSGEDL